jgi:hypothetical protein
MALIPLDLAPGVFRNGTAYQGKGRWYDANLVRWKNGQLQPVGGWQRIATEAMDGKTRGLISWRDNRSRRWLAAGSNAGLYAYDNDTLVDITPIDSENPFLLGRENSIFGLGWGADRYGQEAYGTERSESGLILEAATWSLDTWGENLIACAPHDGRIFEWAPPASGTDPTLEAAEISGAPQGCRGIVVSEERHLVALGADGDPRKIAWSDQEDNTEWTPSATNAAGDLQIVSPGLLQCARRMPGQILVWTDVDLHVMRYIGQPFVYSIERVGEGGIVGPNAHMAFGNACVWMGDKGFWVFDGAIKALESEVQDYVFGDINIFQGAKVTSAHLNELGEIWWFYPSRNSVENDRYVIWNYRENHWSIGQIARTAWIDSGAFNFPIAAAPDGYLYQHEQGFTDNGATRVGQVFAKTAPIELGNGDQVLSVRQLIPDGCPNVPTCTEVEFEVQFTPMGPATTAGPYTFDRPDRYADARFTGRQVEMTVRGTRDAPFRFGTLRLDAASGGGR